jgi:hypothetical protein
MRKTIRGADVIPSQQIRSSSQRTPAELLTVYRQSRGKVLTINCRQFTTSRERAINHRA